MFQCLLFFSIFILTSVISVRSSAEVYGQDDRRDVYQIRSQTLKSWTEAVAAIAKKSNLRDNAQGGYKLSTMPLEKKMKDLCPAERFLRQPVGPFCTSFLVAPDIIVAAGHCVVDEARCQELAFIFDFQMNSRRSDPSRVEKQSVYYCHKLLYLTATNDFDFALIRLDRAVKNRTPLELRDRGSMHPRDELILMGFPLGLPLKVAAGGHLRTMQGNFIYTTVDAFYKNSGSPVVSKHDGKVEGLLIGGDEEDFVKGPRGCMNTHFCAEDRCGGNYLHSSRPIARKLAEFVP